MIIINNLSVLWLISGAFLGQKSVVRTDRTEEKLRIQKRFKQAVAYIIFCSKVFEVALNASVLFSLSLSCNCRCVLEFHFVEIQTFSPEGSHSCSFFSFSFCSINAPEIGRNHQFQICTGIIFEIITY